MKKQWIILILVMAMALFACAQHDDKAGAADKAKPAKKDNPMLEKADHKGKVINTMNSGGYTYVEFEEGARLFWVAAKEFEVAVGDTITFGRAAPMRDFYSKTLDRKFDVILFAGQINVNGKAPARKLKTAGSAPHSMQMPAGHAPVKGKPMQSLDIKPGSVKKADGGNTVEECHTLKDTLKGKTVTVRGKVVKFSANIMGKNWLHLRDGSGKQGTNDLTVTTKDTVKKGDLVLITGKIAYDKDFGYGYKYAVIVEEASIKKEEVK